MALGRGSFLQYIQVLVVTVKGTQVSTTDWHLPFTSTRIKSCAAAAADLQHPLEEFKVKSRNEALCALGKLAAQVFNVLDILRS